MKIGYARVSTKDQSLFMQVDALEQACCTQIHEEIASGAKTARPALDEIIKNLREEDTLVIWKERHCIDETGNTLLHYVAAIPELLEAILKLLPESQRVAAIKTANKRGHTVLHQVCHKFELLQLILNLIPEHQRLDYLASIKHYAIKKEYIDFISKEKERLEKKHHGGDKVGYVVSFFSKDNSESNGDEDDLLSLLSGPDDLDSLS